MEIFTNIQQCHWTLKNSIASIYRAKKVTTALPIYLAYDLQGQKAIYVPFKFYPNFCFALLRKKAFGACKDMLTFVNNFQESKIFLEHRHTKTFFTTVDTRTIWVAEVFDGLYATFYIENLYVSLINKSVLSFGYALYRAEQFIKFIKEKQ